MNRSAAVVLMWGKEGLGPVQLQERDLAYAIRDNDRSLRELNVLLPGSPAPKGSWANIDTWIMFDGGPDDPDAFASLVAAIKGEARSAVRSCTSGFEVSQHSSSVQ